MNLMDRKQQEEFFLDYLTRMLPQGRSVHVAESSYEEERSAMLYRTSAGPLVVCINDIEKPETDVPHRTGFIARLLSEIGQKEPEEYHQNCNWPFRRDLCQLRRAGCLPWRRGDLRLGFHKEDLAAPFLHPALG